MHELDLPRHYRTILRCDSFGIGATRAQDRLALRRIFEHRLWRDDVLVAQEEHRLLMNLYFAQELVLILEDAGFRDVAVEGRYTVITATPGDATVVFVAR